MKSTIFLRALIQISYMILFLLHTGICRIKHDFLPRVSEGEYTWREESGNFFLNFQIWSLSLLPLPSFSLSSFPSLTRSHGTWLGITFPIWKGLVILLCLLLMIILGSNVNVPYKLLCLWKLRHSWGLVCAMKEKKMLTCDHCPVCT